MAAATSNRRLTIILAVGGVAIALFAAYSLFSGGGDGGGSTPTLAPPAAQTADSGHGGAQETPTTTAPGSPTLPNGQFDVFATRNPFEPAITIEPSTDTGGTAAGGTTPTGGGTTPTDGGTTPTTAPASPEPAAGTTVALIDVFDQGGTTVAVVQVGSTQYTVAAGQVFATNYKVVALSGTCGQFMFGDSPFSLCEGEQVIK
jgi:hypothetical protein